MVISCTQVDNIWNIGNSIQVFKATMTNRKCSEPAQFISKNSRAGNRRKCKNLMENSCICFQAYLFFTVTFSSLFCSRVLWRNCSSSECFWFVIIALKSLTEFPMFQIMLDYVWLITKFQLTIFGV